jgi:gliding motility-associated-like protein
VEESITIMVIEPYTLNEIPDQLVCPGESVTLLASTDPANVSGSYSWLYPDGSTDDNASTTFVPEGSGTYTVTFVDAAGCFPSQTETVFVEVIDGLEAPVIEATDINGDVIIPGSPVFNGESVTLTAVSTSGLEYTYEWINGSGTPPNGSGPSITVVTPVPPDGQEEGTLSYSLIYTSVTGGCADTIDFSLPVFRAEFRIPDLITPNSDGTNDLFRVFYNGVVTEFNLLIFNRWGQLVYETNDPEAGWDGSKDGEAQPMDVYIYRIQFSQNGVREERDGQFSLVR